MHETENHKEPVADITDRADIETVVRTFYGAATTDPIIGYLFVEVARLDLEAHIPVIVDFWESRLLGTGSYKRNAFARHAALHVQEPLTSEHFARWLVLWTTALDDGFAGPIVERAKVTATLVAEAFHARLHGATAPLLRLEPPTTRT